MERRSCPPAEDASGQRTGAGISGREAPLSPHAASGIVNSSVRAWSKLEPEGPCFRLKQRLRKTVHKPTETGGP